jgi:hypothetical protein
MIGEGGVCWLAFGPRESMVEDQRQAGCLITPQPIDWVEVRGAADAYINAYPVLCAVRFTIIRPPTKISNARIKIQYAFVRTE